MTRSFAQVNTSAGELYPSPPAQIPYNLEGAKRSREYTHARVRVPSPAGSTRAPGLPALT